MIPFKVSWHLSQPVCQSDRPLHLDALLAWARVQEAVKSGLEVAQALAVQEELPLEAALKDRAKVWKASALLFKFQCTPFLVPMTRRTDPQEMAFARGTIISTTRNKITQSTGAYKDYDMRITCQWVEKVEAYGVGDLEAVKTLLKKVPALGRLTRNGWGEVSEMEIFPDEEALEKWRYRTLPANFEATKWHQPGIGAIRPPYWRREFWEPVWEFGGLW
jgi:CRISPR type IV-associated protein Csf3